MKKLSLHKVCILFLASTALTSPMVMAGDFVVDTATTISNGGATNVVDGNDSISVTANGSIILPLLNHAIFATGNANTIHNAGTLSTSGPIRGINALDGNTITSSGSISTSGGIGIGINSQSNNSVTNSGTITTLGSSAAGISAMHNNTISNSGAITTSGQAAVGILVQKNNTISNSGSISTNANSTSAIFANGEGNKISNSGSLTTGGDFSTGMTAVGDNNQVTNTGSIATSGAISHGLGAVGNGIVVLNSGTIATTRMISYGIITQDNADVTNSGSISTSGDSARAISANDSNVLNNSGTLSTTGEGSYGIQVNDTNTITNSGTLSTSGDFAHAIVANDSNTINNSGTVSASGNDSYVIEVEHNNTVNNTGLLESTGEPDAKSVGVIIGKDGNTIVNSGTIRSTGEEGFGISLNETGSINNAGTIQGSGGSANGIKVFKSITLTNSGTVSVTGEDANAIVMNRENLMANSGLLSSSGDGGVAIILGRDNIFTNTGTIFASGFAGVAFEIDTGNAITNSGKIVAMDKAFNFTGTDNQLNLLAPSFIGGKIVMGSGNEVNITTGRSHSDLWTFEGTVTGVNISGPVPWAWDAGTQVFATMDPTALSAAPSVLANNVGVLSELARTNNLPGEWWLKGYGNFGQTNASGVNNDYGHMSGGIAAGASFVLSENFDLGAFVGYQVSDLNVSSHWVTSQTILGQGVVGGVYGTYAVDGFFADFALYGGFLGNSSDRFVNDNLAPLGVAHALADYNSFYLAPEIRVGANVDIAGDWTLTPSATARFSNQWIDGYSEAGSNANATIGARQVQVFEGELELAATRDLAAGELTVRGGLDYTQGLGGAIQDVVLLGQTLALPMATSGAFGAYVGVDFNYDISNQMTFDLSAKGSYSTNGYAVSGSVGISGLF